MNNNEARNLWRRLLLIVYGAAIAAIYTILTVAFAPISYGPIQARISEALCILPFFTPAAVPGLFVGCILSNTIMGMPIDAVFGSLATLIGALGTYALRNSGHRFLASVPPILSNMVIIPWVLRYGYGAEDMIWFMMVTVGIGEFLVAGVLGQALMAVLEKYKGVLFHDRMLA